MVLIASRFALLVVLVVLLVLVGLVGLVVVDVLVKVVVLVVVVGVLLRVLLELARILVDFCTPSGAAVVVAVCVVFIAGADCVVAKLRAGFLVSNAGLSRLALLMPSATPWSTLSISFAT